VIAVSAGGSFSLALKSDGTVVAWGNSGPQLNVPAGLSGVIAISAGYNHGLALKSDGTVVAWGDNYYGQLNVPAGLSGVTAIAAASYHNLALKNDGTVVGWGNNDYGQLDIPAGLTNVVAIAASGLHNLALKSDGNIVPWGTNGYGQSNIPAALSGVTVAIADGYLHSLALKSDGTVVAWGTNSNGALNVPAGLSGVTAISATDSMSNLALKSDGTIVGWGFNCCGQLNIPPGLSDVLAISAAFYHSLAIYTPPPDNTPPTTSASTTPPSPNVNGWFKQNVTVNLSATDNSGGSGVKSITYSVNGGTASTVNATSTSVNVTAEGTNTLNYYATDNAGNVESTAILTIRLDKTAPTVTATPDRAPNNYGWYKSPVTFSFSGSDGNGSGVTSCDANKTYSGPDSVNGSVAGTCTDAAGNVGSKSASIKYDATNPSVGYAGNNGSYTLDQTVSITCNATDNLSGIDSSTCVNITGPAYSFNLGTNTGSASATDKAGNTGSGSTAFTVSVTFDSLCTLSTNFSKNPGVTSGLCDKLASAKAAAVSGDTRSKNNILNAYRNQLSAQSGKALTEQQAAILANLSHAL